VVLEKRNNQLYTTCIPCVKHSRNDATNLKSLKLHIFSIKATVYVGSETEEHLKQL